MNQTDHELVTAARGSDHSAFAALYDRYAPLIRAICFDVTGNLNEAQDLAQETFLRAYKNLAALENTERFDAWLVGIARRIGKEWRRSRAKDRKCRTYISSDALASDTSASGNLELLYSAIQQLPEDERLAIHVFYLEEQSIEQASGLFGYSRSGFYRLLERARKRLERLLRACQETEK
jgi:RNA polymerase sigma-70 factor (ECF subfamily)